MLLHEGAVRLPPSSPTEPTFPPFPRPISGHTRVGWRVIETGGSGEIHMERSLFQGPVPRMAT